MSTHPPGMPPLDPNEKLDVEALLEDLESYRPRRKGWHWREQVPDQKLHKFVYKETSKGLERSIPLPAAHYFGDIDPQPDCVVTTEIASGRFEDDIRRMRMAAWHGADHMMVIRTAGQSHMDGLLEGTPEGVGGIAVTRKQVRATRKALDLIEDEVGRPINFHSYVSGVAGPEMAVMFAEEGVNGAHQDPQYNVLYRNINMYRSFVDAAVAKHVMASVRMAQIDGAHNANATAVEAWNVMPELLVQHAINSAVLGLRGHAQGGHLPEHRAAGRRAGSVHAHGPALRGRPARPLRRVQDARPGEHALHGGRRPRRHRQPRHEPHDQPAHQRRHPEHDHARRGPQRALALQQRRRREHGQAEPGGHGRPARDGQARPRGAGAQARRCARSRSAPSSSSRRCSRTAATSAPSRRRTSSTPASTPRPTTTASRARATAAWRRARSCLAPPTTSRRCATTSARTTCRRGTTRRAARPQARPPSPATSSAAARSATPTRCRSSTSSTPRTTSTRGSRRRRSCARSTSSSRRSSGRPTAGSSSPCSCRRRRASRSSRRSSSARP